jgi:coenzyme PQQ precursor peptide PqqA
MKTPWIRPDFEEICVSGECTAYAGVAPASPARTAGEPPRQSAAEPSGSARVRREDSEAR